jgi:AraC family transcriptional regulator
MPAGTVPVTLGSTSSRCVQADGFLVTSVRFPPLLKLPLHTHERATVAIILHGSFDGLMRSSSHPCPPASALTEPAGEPHGNLFERAGAAVLTVQPDPGRHELLEPFGRVLDEVGHIRDLGVAALARRAAGELRDPDTVTPFAVEGLVLELLALMARLRDVREARASRQPPSWLSQARDLMHDRYPERLRVADLAEAVGVHPVHLARAFRRHYGAPVGAYQRGLRLSWAAGRLADGDEEIAQIALRAGFFDQSHLTRAFKRQFGFTPAAYRQAAKQ